MATITRASPPSRWGPRLSTGCCTRSSTGSPAVAAQRKWLDAKLGDGPAVVCLHHPPIPIGIPFLDRRRLADGAEPADVIRRHNVIRVMAGHVHRPVTAAFAGAILTTAPSTYLQSGLAMTDTVPDYVAEPTSFLLHVDGLTHTVPVSHAAGTVARY